jgi:TetR/AcrR family transcriptional regulator, copper-responsive repressor
MISEVATAARGRAFSVKIAPTAASEAIVDPDTRSIVMEGLREFDPAFASCFRAAVEKGELPKSIDSEALAHLASATIHTLTTHTLALRARARVPRKQLETIAEGAIDLICEWSR